MDRAVSRRYPLWMSHHRLSSVAAPTTRGAALATIALLGLLSACAAGGDKSDQAGGSAAVPDPTDSGAAEDGSDCPAEGRSIARSLRDGERFPGEIAVGVGGDVLVANRSAAFVITAPDRGSTYWYYGGAVADAVAMDGCDYAGVDKLDELGLVIGQFDLGDFTHSVLRAFRATELEVVADGRDGGAAVVRATGVDATHWLVEYELMKEALGGEPRPLSEPYGLEVVVDYVLQPDSPVLQIDLQLTNTGDERLQLLTASLLSFGPTMDLHRYPTGALAVGPLDLGYGMPWIVATDGEDALAYAVEQGNLAYVGVSGIDVALDLDQALSAPVVLDPGTSQTVTTFLTVGAGAGPSATGPLAAVNPEPVPGAPAYAPAEVAGRVVGPDGAGVAGAQLFVEARAPGAEWGVLDEDRADGDGAFTTAVPDFGEGWDWRLRAAAAGRHDSAAVEVRPGEVDVELTVSAAGQLDYTVVDDVGELAPARLHLVDAEGGSRTVWLDGSGTQPVPPGSYSFTATRGYEHAPVTGTLEVLEGGSAALELTMVPLVDTSGWVSIDTHVHSWDSPDSRVDPEDVLLHAAAHGLDLVLHTEHEHIVDRSGLPAESGLDRWVDSIGGEEVTASVPEHLTMFPVEPDGSYRGGPVEWFGRDLDELFGLMRERSGGGVNLLNHPSYLGDIDWDRILAEPGMDDPTLLGLAPDAALWSWDLDGIEVMNGHGVPFAGGNERWLDWQSMLNAGRPLVAVGCSDDHGGMKVGFPRTYVPASTDVPREVATDEVVVAFHEGRALASAGAFARLQVDGVAGIGDLHAPTGDTVELALSIEAIPEIDVTHAVVFWNCDTLLQVPASDPGGVVKLDERLSIPVDLLDGDGHLTVAAFGAERLPLGMPQFDPAGVPRVITSPVWIDLDGDGSITAPGGRECDVFIGFPEG